MNPVTTAVWQVLATKAPELIVLALTLIVGSRLATRWIDRVADARARQMTALTELGRAAVDRFLRAQEAQSIAMSRISETLEKSRTGQQDMDLAIRAMASKIDDLTLLTKEIHERGDKR